MKTILLWDPRFPDRKPTRLTIDDAVASAAVRAGVATAANPAEAGALAAGGPLEPGALTEVVLQHGSGNATRRVFLPLNVAAVGAAAGVIAAVGSPIAGTPAPSTGIYAGFTQRYAKTTWAASDIMGPAYPKGIIPTRTYQGSDGVGARGTDGGLGTLYDTDPWHTGYNDANRGVAGPWNNMVIASDSVSLKARTATSQERALFQPGAKRLQVAAMLSFAGQIGYYPGVAGDGDVIVEVLASFSPGPAGSHMTAPWDMSVSPVNAVDSDENDWEANSQIIRLNKNTWTGGAVSSAAGSPLSTYLDGVVRRYTMIQNKTNIRMFVDGNLVATNPTNTNSKNKAKYPIVTSHILDGSYQGEVYDAAAWASAAGTTGQTLVIKDIRVWTRDAKVHIKPLQTIADANIAFGGSVVIQLPSIAALWGDAGYTEYWQSVQTEINEPGASDTAIYAQFPAGVTFDATARTITVAPTSAKAGRLNFLGIAHNGDGSSYEPARFCVNVGPVINVSAVPASNGQPLSFDLYAACDCGVLVSNASGQRAKAIAVTGLPTGFAYSDTTGLITGSSATNGSTPFNVTVTNSLGQTATKSVNLVVAASAPWDGDANLYGHFDPNDSNTTEFSTGTTLSRLINKAGRGNLTTPAGSAAPTIVANIANGRAVIRNPKGGSTSTNGYLRTSGTDLANILAGTDKEHVMINVFIPRSATTGFVAGWSAIDNVDGTTTDQAVLVRREPSGVSSQRYGNSAAAPDVNIGTLATNVLHIVAYRRTAGVGGNPGTDTVWVNSTTPVVNNVARAITKAFPAPTFALGNSEGTNSITPGPTAFGGDECYSLEFNASKTDAQIASYINALATMFAKTLT